MLVNMMKFPSGPTLLSLITSLCVAEKLNKDELQTEETGLAEGFNDASAANAKTNTVHLLPDEADFREYASSLRINAQNEPYNLPENVFIITREDMVTIGDTIRQNLENLPAEDLIKPLLSDYKNVTKLVEKQGFDQVFDMQSIEDWKSDIIDAYILEHQAGFVEYAYEQAGYGTEKQGILDYYNTFLDTSEVPPLTEKQAARLEELGLSSDEAQLLNITMSIDTPIAAPGLKNYTIEDLPPEIAKAFQQLIKLNEIKLNSVMKQENEELLGKMTGNALLSLEARSYMMSAGASGGILEMLAPDFYSQRTSNDGSVIIGDDATLSDGHFIQQSLSFDLSKMNPDFMHICYLPEFINFHETGHHVMGEREELAEQYGALKYMQQNPGNTGTLEMMRDFRNLHFIISETPANLMLYSQTDDSLSHVLGMKQSKIDSLSETDLTTVAREGHVPDEVSGRIFEIGSDTNKNHEMGTYSYINTEELERQLTKIGNIKDELALRVALFEEYQNQEQLAGTENTSTIVPYYLDMNKAFLAFSEYWSREDASFEGMNQNEEILQTSASTIMNAANTDFEQDLDPVILAKSVKALLPEYEPESTEHEMLSAAATALENFENPVSSYGLETNFEVSPGWDDPVVHLFWDEWNQSISYDGFANLRQELEDLDSMLAPKPDYSPNVHDGIPTAAKETNTNYGPVTTTDKILEGINNMWSDTPAEDTPNASDIKLK